MPAAIPAMVTSSCVGPIPPVVMTQVIRPWQAATSSLTTGISSGTTEIRRRSTPSMCRLRAGAYPVDSSQPHR